MKFFTNLIWSKQGVVVGWYYIQRPEFKVCDTKLYVLVVTLSIKDNVKLLKQLGSGFKRNINWIKYLRKQSSQDRTRYLELLVDTSFQGVAFILSFKDEDGWETYNQCYLLTVEIKDPSGVIDGRNFFDQLIKIPLITIDNIRKIVTGHSDDYTTVCLLDYFYFKK